MTWMLSPNRRGAEGVAPYTLMQANLSIAPYTLMQANLSIAPYTLMRA